MTDHLTPFDLDPGVTEDEVRAAHLGPGAEFPLVDLQDDVTDDEVRSFVAITPATPRQALVNAKRLRDNKTFVGVGRCLATVRGPIYRLPALWPNANVAIAHGDPVHRVGAFDAIPRGAVIGYRNAHLGHVTVGLGAGLTDTTDYHRAGYVGVASIANVAQWCGATSVVWFETLNGYDVWPTPEKPKHEPKPWPLERRLAYLENAAEAARRAGARERARQLTMWAAHLRRRQGR